jgi:hypothetical protein
VEVVVPVPENGTFRRGPETNKLPVAVPAAGGVKVTFTVTLWPGSRVNGVAGALTEKALPVVWKPASLIFQERSLVSVIVCSELLPTATCPNAKLEGLAVAVSLVTPEPASSSKRDEFDALLVKLDCAPNQPVVVGENVTATVELSPADKVSGRVIWDMLY